MGLVKIFEVGMFLDGRGIDFKSLLVIPKGTCLSFKCAKSITLSSLLQNESELIAIVLKVVFFFANIPAFKNAGLPWVLQLPFSKYKKKLIKRKRKKKEREFNMSNTQLLWWLGYSAILLGIILTHPCVWIEAGVVMTKWFLLLNTCFEPHLWCNGSGNTIMCPITQWPLINVVSESR